MPPDDKAAIPDAELELKKRARRRLVGATALALLAAIVLPMVMDHEPRQPVQDVQVKIPSQDTGGFAARILPAKPAPTPMPPAEPESRPEPKADGKAESKPEAKSESKVEAKPPEAPKVEAKPPETARAPEKPVEAPPARKADEARAAAVLGGGAPAEQWIVQLGAYKEAANVKGLVAKLKQMGVMAYTEDFESPQGPRTRVRAGPFASKEAAEKAQAKIRRIGVDGPVAPK